jgi:hypothetical protein
MHIISFATKESNWRTPRLGIILHAGDRDLGYRLDCEKLFDADDQPSNPLDWFNMDDQWFEGARRVAETIVRDEKAFATAKGKRLARSPQRRLLVRPGSASG